MALVLGLATAYAADGGDQTRPGPWKFGSEIDVLPYATGGYYGSVFASRNGWRFRGVAARNNIPSFLVTGGFKDKRTDTVALLADRFFGPKGRNLEGFWIGGGAEHWRNRIRPTQSQEFTNYSNLVLTVGSGYVWRLSRHLYLNPWTGGHFVAAGERAIQVSGRPYKQPLFTPELSVKFGFVL
jgi:hypothetical protein